MSRFVKETVLSASANETILGIFAKEPIAGLVKTRLAAALGAAFAQRVARACLADSLDRFAPVQAERVIVYTPTTAQAYFATLAAGRFSLLPQADGDLGDRLADFFRQARQAGYARIVAVGADSPTLPIVFIERAFAQLATHEAVVGPAADGGYCLIGAGATPLPIFADMPWSTDRLLAETRQRLESAGTAAAWLPEWFDIDTLDDWHMLRDQVRAMRTAGLDPGVPRVEQLLLETQP
jgi:rSAM/selenodomain-associated transferase 1